MCDLTFIIPVHNPGEALDETLVSLRTINIRSALTWEAIIVDMACSDGTTDRIRRWLVREKALRVVFLPGVHHGTAIGQAVEEARGPWIHILRAGDQVDPRGLFHATETARRNGTAVVGGIMLNDHDGRPEYAIMHTAATCTRDDIFDRMHIPTAGVLLSRLAMVGIRDELPTMMARDRFGASDLMMRLAEDGLEWSVTPHVLCARAARHALVTGDAAMGFRDSMQAIHDAYARQAARPVDQRAMHVTPARLRSCVREHAMHAATHCLLSTTFVSAALDLAIHVYGSADVDGACRTSTAVRAGQLAALCRYGTVQSLDPTHPAAWAQALYAWWNRCEEHGWLEAGGASHAWALLAQPLKSWHPERVTNQRLA
jgi:hypothetical protein